MLDLAELFDEYEQLLLSSPAVASFEIIRRRIQDTSAYLHAPHHRHQTTGVSGMADEVPTLAGVLKEIETELS